MPKKLARQMAVNAGASPATGPQIRIIQVRQQILRRSLAEVLSNPLPFPQLRMPEQNADGDTGGEANGAAATGANAGAAAEANDQS
jgi:hypothetical protein